MGIVVMCVGMPTGGASALDEGDQVATSRYLHAAYTLNRIESARVAASIRAIEGKATKIARGCPSALAQAPEGKQLEAFGEEVAAVVLFASMEPDTKAIRDFADRTAQLHWRDGRIAALVHSVAVQERAASALVLPDVCADISAWTASGYRALPQGMTRFLKQFNAIVGKTGDEKAKGESREESILRLLKPHESSRDRQLAQRIRRLERTAGKRILHAFSTSFEGVTRVLRVKSS